ncbi:MAG: thiamine phosphate synthase [Firmicutes bacterium]|nr:thiamine phosphate synthase [Bacillota bacterium]
MENNLNDIKDIDYSLYLVTDRKVLGNRDLCKSIKEAIQGGVSLVQLREKDLGTNEFYKLAKKIKKITDEHDVPLIINDRIDIALAVDADGVHVGPDDLPISVARNILGPNKIVGASTCNIEEALEAQKQGATYLGVGAIFPTATKSNTDDVSIEDLASIKKAVNIPIVGIGGINEKNASKVMTAKVEGIAVVSAILGKSDIKNAANQLYEIIRSSNR